jgi:hypothetical protein
VRYVVVVFEDCASVGARREVKRKRGCMMNVTLVECRKLMGTADCLLMYCEFKA